MYNLNRFTTTITLISLSPFAFMNHLSAATITGNTLTYQNETINLPIIAADAQTQNIKNVVLNNTQVTTNVSPVNGSGWPSAVSLGGSNGYLVGAGWNYGDLTLSVNANSSIAAQSEGVGTILYVRTDTADSLVTINNAGTLSLTSSSNTATSNSVGILGENLSQADTSKIKINLQNGSNINLTTGTNVRGVTATGADLNVITDAYSQITLTNNTTSANAMTGIFLNGRAASGNNTLALENNGAITINGGLSTGVKTGISGVAGANADIVNTGNIQITGNNATAINIVSKSTNLNSTGDITVTGDTANGIITNSGTDAVTDTQILNVGGNITINGNGKAIGATTQNATNTLTLGNTNIIGGSGINGGGVYMSSITGAQQLTSAANISAKNDQAIFGNSQAATTINNNNTVTGYTNFTGGGPVTFNNNGNVALQNFADTETKSTITNNFGTAGIYNNNGTIGFSDKNLDGTNTNAVFNVDTFNNAGIIDLTAKNPTSVNNLVGDTITINGNYVSNGGSIYLNTVLDDATSNGGQGISDKLIINGNVTTGSGATKVFITPTANTANLGQLTTGEGIKVIDVVGNSVNDAFELGRAIVAGAYEYTLHQGLTDLGWFLSSFEKRNTIQYNPAIGAYLANQTAAVQMFQQTFYNRLLSSSAANSNDASKSLFWLSTKINHVRYDSLNGGLSNRANSYTLQIGGDINVWTLDNGGNIHLGIMGGYGHFKDTSKSHSTGTQTEGKINGYSVGAYGTYFAGQDINQGLYVDLWSQMGWYRNQITGEAQLATQKYHSTVWSNSVEVGYGIPFAVTGDYQWLATPQVQLTYNLYDVNDQQDQNKLYVSNHNANGLDTRVGVRFSARGINENLVEPFLEANWLDTTAKNRLDFNGQSFQDGFAKSRFETKIGLQGNLTKQWSVSAQVGGQWGNHDFSSYQGQLNLNYKF
ncbi:autotransporter outer membrane beta-barrel domain-containing protein [Utexia brackfieldae]|uniref:autotransporter family protein n=1 Tax=Utexia brackfieldae TaxID=3074108 RepID=UPI00370D34E7